MIRWFPKRVSRFSIKESFDNLPTGICFADSNGLVVLCNKRMHQLCHELMGKDLQHLSELERALQDYPQDVMRVSPREDGIDLSCENNEGLRPSKSTDALNSGPVVLCRLASRIWRFTKSRVTDREGNVYTQMQAIDVTTLDQAQKELEKENRRLKRINSRAVRLYSQLDEIVKEEENMAAKTRVHDQMGELLGLTRNLMNQDSIPKEKLQAIASRWKRVTSVLVADGLMDQPAFERDQELSLLTETILGIGVRLQIQGEFPADEQRARLLMAAIRECAINTVRHAGGDEVKIILKNDKSSLVATMTNNGLPPEATIREGGGLAGLRQRIERIQGQMRIESSPTFKMILTFPDP